MNLLTTLRALLATCLIASATAATAAPTLVVTNGILMGAKNVDVGGTLYNVAFADNTCIDVFNGCVQSAFAFRTFAEATIAAEALLNQVFIDSSSGDFDTVQGTTFGCTVFNSCATYIPYRLTVSQFSVAIANNFYGAGNSGDKVTKGAFQNTATFATDSSSNLAVFQLSTLDATVPEPSSIALLGLAVAGMTAVRRRKA